MDIEFHYYITYILAKQSGFSAEDAFKIAYSSQYTDDNNKKVKVEQQDGEIYEGYISQTLNIAKPINKLVRIYFCFHFLPGEYSNDSTKRIDGTLHILNTTPDSENAKTMLTEALNTGNLYRIGLATHCYADTWAHQNFIGIKHSFGDMGLKGIKKLLPNIGHAEAEHKPDIPNLVWDDNRLVEPYNLVNNKERFLEAAEAIFKRYCDYNNSDFEQRWSVLKGKLAEAVGNCSAGVRRCNIRRYWRVYKYKQICPEMPDYDEKEWLNKAVRITWRWFGERFYQWTNLILSMARTIYCRVSRKPEKVKLRGSAKDGFGESDWLKFQEAVKEHQESVLKMLEPIYMQMMDFIQPEVF